VFDQRLRPIKGRLLGPVANAVAAVPPSMVTALGLALGLTAAGLAAAGLWPLAVAAWLANRLADGLDGEVARRRGLQSDLGGYLDLVGDAVVYGAIPLGVAAGVGGENAWAAAAVLLAACYVNIVTVTMLAAVLEKRGAGASTGGEPTSVTLPTGLIEGAETIALYTLFLVVPGLAVWTMTVAAVLVAVTAALRVRAARRMLNPKSAPADTTVTEAR
jgi:phosphatidylglycerophosphate synthase